MKKILTILLAMALGASSLSANSLNGSDASYIFDTNKAQVVSYDVMSSDQMVAIEAEGPFSAGAYGGSVLGYAWITGGVAVLASYPMHQAVFYSLLYNPFIP